MTFIDTLIDVDRVVIAGLSAYDTLCQRAWDNTATALQEAGRPDAEIADAAEFHKERVTEARGKLHRTLWLKAFGVMLKADEAPEAGGAVEDSRGNGDGVPVGEA
ncbi:hypothetical protein [Sphingopyxis witflariensis]|uniref:Uncharacterized protein n=1 Tax=Sphingopyxis witflariensis TaxID=173675 RepID=A0A2D0AND8_9SPHN|nr:hypothetical protein [Sphingopyxis witflariensis]OWQ95113.1 hypothetical protein CDQ91_14425 [Sphingopyxis witflariensis]